MRSMNSGCGFDIVPDVGRKPGCRVTFRASSRDIVVRIELSGGSRLEFKRE